MNRTSIEYCTHTWNPVTGCRRGCPYCYAKRINDRFYPGRPFTNITEHFARLDDPGLRSQKPKRIFVGSMSDIEYWSKGFLSTVLDRTVEFNHHEFLFLTKNPSVVYLDPMWQKCCGNVLMGTTFDLRSPPRPGELVTYKDNWLQRPWLSLEPLLGPVTFSTSAYQFVAVGADSTKGAEPPKPDWIRSVLRHVTWEKIVLKKNIKKHMEAVCR